MFLGERYDRFIEMVAHGDLWNDRNKRAFLMTPRERFVTAPNLDRAYQVHYLDIGYGVTITGPNSGTPAGGSHITPCATAGPNGVPLARTSARICGSTCLRCR